jgi:hypothetical protein
MHNTLLGFISHIVLSGTILCKADSKDGYYEFGGNDRKAKWGGVMHIFDIKLRDEGWTILRSTLPGLNEDGEVDYDSIVETPCWLASCGINLPLPPHSGWKSVNKLARGGDDLKIQYFLCDGGVMRCLSMLDFS